MLQSCVLSFDQFTDHVSTDNFLPKKFKSTPGVG